MKIEIGMYIRTDKGYIGKKIFDKYKDKDLRIGNITKASFNMVDLIEEGDYINGYKVIKIDDNNSCIRVDGFSWGTNTISYENIKTMVTKEQFKEREFEVE